jgi:hypothetical protein
MKRQRNNGDDESNSKHSKQAPQSNNNEVQIPSDCLFNVFTFCSAEMIAFILPVVCKTWKQIAAEQLLWKQICFRDWPILNESDKQDTNNILWKEFYKYHALLVSPLYHKGLCFSVLVSVTQLTL